MLIAANKSYDDPSSYFVRVLSVLKSIFQINSKLILTAIFCLNTSVSHAADSTVTKSQTPQQQSSAIESKPSSLPEWFYKELSSIQREVSVLDATGATKDSVQALKERLTKVEVQLKQSQLRVDGSLKVHGDRIEDLHKSVSEALTENGERIEDLHASSELSLDIISWVTSWFGIIAGVLGIIIAVISFIFSSNSKVEAVASAREEAEKYFSKWAEEKEKSFRRKLEVLDKRFDDQAQQHKVKFEEIRDDAKLQSAENEIIEALASIKYERTDEALIRINSVIQRFKINTSIKYQRMVSKALSFKAFIYNGTESYDQEILAYEELYLLFKASDDIDVQKRVATALVQKGITLGKLESFDKALSTYSHVVNKFNKSEESEIQEVVAGALYNSALIFKKLQKSEEEIKLYIDIVKRFGDHKEPEIQILVIKALLYKGITLGKTGTAKDLEEAFQTFDNIIYRFSDNYDLDILKQVASTLTHKVELVIAHKDKSEAKISIANAVDFLTKTFSNDKFLIDKAVIEFFNFLMEDVQINNVLEAINKIPNTESLVWEFTMIYSVIEQLNPPRREQAKEIVRFFEEHKDKEKLKIELAKISSN